MVVKSKYIIEGENRTEHLFNALDRSISATDKRMSSIKSTGLAVGTALAAAFGGARLIGSLREFGTLTASLETVTGGADAARDALAWIEPFAAKTPFQLEELVGGFVKLTALGLQPSEQALISYGNTASAMGKSLDQFIEAVADATTGEFERLKEFGIKSSSEGDRVTFTFRGMSTTVAKEATAIEGYLRRIGDVDFAGAMDRRAATLDGALSNLEDSFSALIRSMGEAGLTMVVSGAAKAMSVLTANMAAAVTEGDSLLRVFTGLGSGIAEIVRGSDAKALAEVELEMEAIERRIVSIQEQSGRGAGSRQARIRELREEIAALERRRDGLLAVMQPEEFGAAPRAPQVAAGGDDTGGDAGAAGGGISKAFAKEVEWFEKQARANAKLQREFARERADLAEEQARDQVKLTEKLRSQQEERVADLERALLSERELVQQNLDERLQLVRVARAQELDSTMEYAELERRVREDAAKEIAEIERRELTDLEDDTKQHFEELTRAVQGWGDEATEAFLNFATGAKTSVTDLIDSVLRDIARLLIRETITNPLGDLLVGTLKGALGGGLDLGGLFGGGSSALGLAESRALGLTGSRAAGGPAFRGQALYVGEQGPEVFIPSTTGRIVPMAAGGGSEVVVQVINPPSQPQVRDQGVQNGRRMVQVAFEESFGDSFRTGRLSPAGLRPPLTAR